jgi:MFS family permease
VSSSRGLDFGPLRRSRDLRLLFVGGGASFLGTMLGSVAVPYQLYRQSHSSLVVGLVSLAELGALLITGLVGGVLADAVDRRRLLRLTEAGLGLTAVALLVNSLIGRSLPVVFLVVFLQAGLTGLQRPSLDALIPRLVSPEDIAGASAVMSLRYQVGQIAGPALAGLAISGFGLPTVYGIDATTFLVSMVALWRLGATPAPAEGSEISLKAVGAGLRYAWSRPDLLGSYVVDVNAMFFGMPEALFPQLAGHLGGPAVLGVLYSAPAAGALLVTVSSGWHRRIGHQGRLILIAASVWGLAIVGLGFAGQTWEAAAALVVAGGADMVSGLGRMTMWNESVPDAMRGRLAGIEMLSYTSGPTLGNVESGVVESLAGLRASIVSGGLLCTLGTAAVALTLPALRSYHSESGRSRRTEPGRGAGGEGLAPTAGGREGTAPPPPGSPTPGSD